MARRCCAGCKKIFYGDPTRRFCPDCAKKSRSQNVIRDRICIDCGTSFSGGPRAMRCPDCRAAAKKTAAERYRKNGTMRPLGSLDKCQVCGNDFVVESSSQKYCLQCKKEAVLKWQREHKSGYYKKPEQIQAKWQRLSERRKVCEYCQKLFWSDVPSNFCSDYCRNQQHRISLYKSDIKRGYNCNIQALFDARDEYRKQTRAYAEIPTQ